MADDMILFTKDGREDVLHRLTDIDPRITCFSATPCGFLDESRGVALTDSAFLNILILRASQNAGDSIFEGLARLAS